MQQTSMARKPRVLFNGEEIPGLIKAGELSREKDAIEVPSYKIKRSIQTGVTKLPELELTYEVRRDTKTGKFFKDYYLNDEVKDVTLIYADASGTEYERKLLSSCECRKLVEPEADLGAVSYAQITVTILPYDITEVS